MNTALKRMLVIPAALLCLLLITSLTVFAASAEGELDGGLHYSYVEATGTLTVSGTGPMTSLNKFPVSRSLVRHVVIAEGVTALPASAFKEYSSLESVSVAGSVKSIGDYAFEYCPKLQTVTLGEGVEEIGKYALAQYEHNNTLTRVDLPGSLKSLGEHAFDGSKISSVNIPAGVKVIPGDLFRNCRELKEVILPEGVTELSGYAFRNSYAENVTLPESLTTIGAGAFFNCFYLRDITIPSKVRDLPEGTFSGCRELDTVKVLGWLQSIGPECFSGSGLKLLEFTGGALGSVASNAFYRLSLVVRYDNSIGSAELWNSLRGKTFGAINCHWAHSAACGMQAGVDDVTWRYENKTLYIDGTGRMWDFTDKAAAEKGQGSRPPWYPMGDTIERVIIGEGVTYVGNYSFNDCRRCRSVLFPSTLTGLGKRLLYQLDSSLTTVCFMGDLPDIDDEWIYPQTGLSFTVYYRQDESDWKSWHSGYDSGFNVMLLSGSALPVWVSGQQVTVDMEELVMTDSFTVCEGVRYFPGSKALSMDGASLTAPGGTEIEGVCVIYADQDLTIRLDGKPSELRAADTAPSYGILVNGSLSITGSGTLFVTAGSRDDDCESCGVCANALTVTGASVTAAGGETYLNSFGVRLISSTPELRLVNAELNAVGSWAGAISAGINMKGGTVEVDDRSRVHANGFTVACYFEGAEPQVSIPESYRIYGGSSADAVDSLSLLYSETNSGYYFMGGGQLAKYLCIDTSPVYYYDIYVDGVMLDSVTLSRNEHIRYVPAEGTSPATLYLYNAEPGRTMSGSGDRIYNAAAIYAKGDLDIVVSGDNTVTGPDPSVGNKSYGIYVEGSLRLSGSGTLSAAGGSPALPNDGTGQKGSYGIWARSFSMSDPGLCVSAVGSAVSGAKSNFNRSYGIYTENGAEISGGTLSAIAGSGDRGYGIYLADGQLVLSSDAEVTVYGLTKGISLSGSDTLSGCADRMLVIGLEDPNAPRLLEFSASSLGTRRCAVCSAGAVSLEVGSTVKYRLPDTGYDIPVRVIAAQYVNGQMTAVQIANDDLTRSDEDRFFTFEDKEDAEYRLFIAASGNYAPACQPWISE